MKFIKILVLLLVIPFYSYSQESFPKKLVIERDTLVGVSLLQLQKINLGLTQRREYKLRLDNSLSRISLLENKVDLLTDQVKTADTMMLMYKRTIYDYEKIISTQKDIMSAERKKLHNQKVLVWTVGGVCVGVGIVGVILLVAN